MKEYWINVYRNGKTKEGHIKYKYGTQHPCRENAMLHDRWCLYRIHVKMKDNYPYPKNSGFYRQKLTRPKRWMT